MSELLPLPVSPERDELFFASVLSGLPVRVAAERASLTLDQAYRRLRRPEFQQRLSEGRAAVTSSLAFRIAELLSEVSSRAISVLDDVQSDPSVAPSVRVAAARAALQTVLKIAELEEARSGLGQRIGELERELAVVGVHPSGAALRGSF